MLQVIETMTNHRDNSLASQQPRSDLFTCTKFLDTVSPRLGTCIHLFSINFISSWEFKILMLYIMKSVELIHKSGLRVHKITKEQTLFTRNQWGRVVFWGAAFKVSKSNQNLINMMILYCFIAKFLHPSEIQKSNRNLIDMRIFCCYIAKFVDPSSPKFGRVTIILLIRGLCIVLLS